MTLSPEQLDVVNNAEGHILVLSGPGSGKTHTITEKIISLFQRSVIPEPFGLLAITFTNAASNEMRARLRLKGFSQWDRIRVDTFHGFGYYILTCYGGDVGIREDFDVIEPDDQLKLLSHIGASHLKGVKPYDIKKAIEGFKQRDIYPDANPEKLPKSIIPTYKQYQNKLQERNQLDFGDLVALAVRLLQESSLTRRLFTNYFRYLVVDEFQDTDRLQLDLVKVLAENAIGSTIVADDDQSIYRFRGADRTNVVAIEKALTCEVKLLGANFRSDQVIVEAAKSVIENEPARTPKHLRAISKEKGKLYKQGFPNPLEEAIQVANWIGSLMNEAKILDWGEVAIITRNRYRAEHSLSELDRNRIPWFDRSRLNFFDSWETTLGLAILSLASNPESSDEFYKVLVAVEDGGLAFHLGVDDALDVAHQIKSKIHSYATIKVKPSMASEILEVSGIEEIINKYSWSQTDAKRKITNLGVMTSDVVNEAEALQISLLGATQRLAGTGATQVMSGHGSKGREFDLVFFMGLEDDVIPSYHSHKKEDDISEERRIFYVSLTRARKIAVLTYALERANKRGDVYKKKPSRFIGHIPEDFFSSTFP